MTFRSAIWHCRPFVQGFLALSGGTRRMSACHIKNYLEEKARLVLYLKNVQTLVYLWVNIEIYVRHVFLLKNREWSEFSTCLSLHISFSTHMMADRGEIKAWTGAVIRATISLLLHARWSHFYTRFNGAVSGRSAIFCRVTQYCQKAYFQCFSYWSRSAVKAFIYLESWDQQLGEIAMSTNSHPKALPKKKDEVCFALARSTENNSTKKYLMRKQGIVGNLFNVHLREPVVSQKFKRACFENWLTWTLKWEKAP